MHREDLSNEMCDKASTSQNQKRLIFFFQSAPHQAFELNFSMSRVISLNSGCVDFDRFEASRARAHSSRNNSCLSLSVDHHPRCEVPIGGVSHDLGSCQLYTPRCTLTLRCPDPLHPAPQCFRRKHSSTSGVVLLILAAELLDTA